MRFEWDPAKADSNLEKHGVDFPYATTVFGSLRVEWEENRPEWGEVRVVLVGRAEDGKLLTVVYTVRGNAYRIISARRSNRHERRAYSQIRS